MCGIAGIIGRLSDSNRGALRRMNDALRHRGPDGEGYWESPPGAAGQGVMLAHRRLAILDLSNAASQPMCDPVFGHVIVLNGEIYNYVELRNRLRAAGHRFESSGDTAVMRQGHRTCSELGKVRSIEGARSTRKARSA